MTDSVFASHFTTGKLLRYCFGPIMMMILTSIYGVVDGFFVSNYAGAIPFAAVNLVMPFLMIIGGFGFMFGTGGSALCAKTMGKAIRTEPTGFSPSWSRSPCCLASFSACSESF